MRRASRNVFASGSAAARNAASATAASGWFAGEAGEAGGAAASDRLDASPPCSVMSTPARIIRNKAAPPMSIQNISRLSPRRARPASPDVRSHSITSACRDFFVRRCLLRGGGIAARPSSAAVGVRNGTTNGGVLSPAKGIFNILWQLGHTTPCPACSCCTRNTNRQSGHTNPLHRRELSIVSGTPPPCPATATQRKLSV